MAKTQQKGTQIKDQSVREVDIDFGLDAGDVNAESIPPSTTNFDNNLSATDTTVQKALDTLDDIDIGEQAHDAIIAQDFDDFIFGTTESGDIGKWGWIIFDIKRPLMVYKTAPFGRYGVIEMRTKNVNGAGGTLGTPAQVNFRSHGGMRFRLSVRTETDIAHTGIRVGFHDQSTQLNQPRDGIYFQYDTSVSPNWYKCTASNNARTLVDTGIVVASTTWYKMEAIISDANDSIEFFINDVSMGSINTNMPTADGREFTAAMTIFARETKNKSMFVDYYWMFLPLLDR